MRTLLFTGKGGVGKTTMAAATAVRCAEAGLRTLALSTDVAHSLGDAFGRPLDGTVQAVAPRLDAQQLDSQTRMERSWAEIRSYLLELFDWAGIDDLSAEELLVVPGLDELFALSDIERHGHSGQWDVLIVDCAPTADTIRLLSLPDVAGWYMERLFPVGRRLNRVMGPLLARATTLPVADEAVFSATQRLYGQLERAKGVLADPARTSIRLVLNPERLVIAEARRTATYLALFGYGVDAVIANRLLPEAVQDPWFDRWKARQADHLAEVEEDFAPLPLLRCGWAEDEPVGIDRLRCLAEELYGDADPAAVLHDGSPLSVRREGDRFVLGLDVPFVDRDEIDLSRRGDELLVRIGAYRRSLILPASLRRRVVVGAELRDAVLRVTFADEPFDEAGAAGDRCPPSPAGRGRR